LERKGKVQWAYLPLPALIFMEGAVKNEAASHKLQAFIRL
jgi:hypothetical protein